MAIRTPGTRAIGPWRQGLHLMRQGLGRGRNRPHAVVLSVAWGTLSMMLLLSFGEGLKRVMAEGLGGLTEAPLVITWPGATTRAWQGLKPGRAITFTDADLDALRRGVPELADVAGERTAWATPLSAGRVTVTSRVTGAFPCYERIRAHVPERGGRFLNDEDMRARRRVIFLGPDLAKRLFADQPAVGQVVMVRGVPFTVVGVMVRKKQMSMYGGPDVDKATIPATTYAALFGEGPYHNLLYTVRPPLRPAQVEASVRKVLAARQRFDPADESCVNVWDTVKMREQSGQLTAGIQVFLGLVGAMTMLVAGVGLANMLFVMVQRRTREIGMQMAIGARSTVVLARTAGESLVLAGVGGYLGIAVGWLVVEVIQKLPPTEGALSYLGRPVLSPMLALVTVVLLIGVGCLAGALPARRAARLNPVEALRHE